MKIVKSIVNALTKAEEKRGVASVATVRQDTVRKAIERGEFEKIKCAYSMTDDYAWDAVNNNGWKDNVSQETMAREYSILTPSCWVSPKKFIINGIECYEISISFHSNLAYDMYVPVDGKKSEPVVKEEEQKVEAVKEVEQVEAVEEKTEVVEWVEEKKKMYWADLEKLPNGLGEKILEQFMSDYEWIKWSLERNEAIELINAVGIDAHCTIYGIHGWKASLSFNNPHCLYWNVYDIEDFEGVFKKKSDTEEITGYVIEDVCYCSYCVASQDMDINGAEKIIAGETWDVKPLCYKCGEGFDVVVVGDEDEDEESEENKCTFCGGTGTCDTKNVGGYEILESCTDCEKEILEGNEEDEVPEELYLCNGCDDEYHEEMSEGQCCEGHDFRIVSKGDMGYHD
ncbi:TPA: hypothetical protein QC364_000783 [Bacillus cereus]|nr:hypothetical protein [Bacillus cereus]